MRKSRQEAAETRQRIVESASVRFRENGIDATALADLMAQAGLSHGGFYKHFASKEQVVLESLELASNALRDGMSTALEGKGGINAAVAAYLSAEHRDNPGGGCPFVALSGELARGSEEVRHAATEGIERLIAMFASEIDAPPAAAKKRALLMVSTMIGALSLARMVDDATLSDTILREARKALAQ
ncbi:TetR/AcrR family transcriptional regulator [Caballeronia insecticola]|uniref:Transcriptional regulator TetR family n=1 Tax=Caballeronia insecticola TaxID=758793 RepID=R4WYR4_9BURK|nr:TetR/AcrR family transcriptional regulator [Caballeronia insecticola]BAN26685.1 transcriptional regulator TetR family [Caballeronia insecticola]